MDVAEPGFPTFLPFDVKIEYELDFNGADVIKLVRVKNYRVHLHVGIISNISQLGDIVFDTTVVLALKWHVRMQPVHKMSFKSAF